MSFISSGRKLFMLFLISQSIIKLMFSSTFVCSPFFFMLIGYCVSQLLVPAEEGGDGVEKHCDAGEAGIEQQLYADMVVEDNPKEGG